MRRGRGDCAVVAASDGWTIKKVHALHEPTIFTGVLGHSRSLWSNWTRQRMLDAHGAQILDEHELHFNGAGSYFRRLARLHGSRTWRHTLSEVVGAEQPGNIFLPSKTFDGLLPSAELLPPLLSAMVQRASKTSLDIRVRPRMFVSLGDRGRWNPVHNHAVAFFVQVVGVVPYRQDSIKLC